MTPKKRRRGRPKGLTNGEKKKVTFIEQSEKVLGEEDPEKVEKGPGRLKGSKNKAKTETVTSRVFVRRSKRNINKNIDKTMLDDEETSLVNTSDHHSKLYGGLGGSCRIHGDPSIIICGVTWDP